MPKYYLGEFLAFDIPDGCLMDQAIQAMQKQQRQQISKGFVKAKYGEIPVLKAKPSRDILQNVKVR